MLKIWSRAPRGAQDLDKCQQQMLAAAAKQVGAPWHAVPPRGVAASHLPLLSRQKPMLVPTQGHGQYGCTPVIYCQHALAAFCDCSLTKRNCTAYMAWVFFNLGPDVAQRFLQLSPAFDQPIAVNLHSQMRVGGALSVEKDSFTQNSEGRRCPYVDRQYLGDSNPLQLQDIDYWTIFHGFGLQALHIGAVVQSRAHGEFNMWLHRLHRPPFNTISDGSYQPLQGLGHLLLTHSLTIFGL